MMNLPKPLFDVPSTQGKAKATDPVRQPHDRRVFSTPSNPSRKRRVRSYAPPIAPFWWLDLALRPLAVAGYEGGSSGYKLPVDRW
jgi:hypothetical protein